MKKLIAIMLVAILCCTCIALPALAAENDWKTLNATVTGEGQLKMGQQNAEAIAYYVAKEMEDAWTFSADVDVSGYNGDMAIFSVALASGDKNGPALSALLNFGIWNSEQYQVYQIWYNGCQAWTGSQWEDHNGNEPVGGAEENKKALTSRVFKLTVEKKAGENFLHILVKDTAGETKLNFVTDNLGEDIMRSISFVGVRTWSGNAEINNFKLVNASEQVVLLPPDGGWKLQNAEEIGKGYLTMGKENEDATAYYVKEKVEDAWTLTTGAEVAGYNGGPAVFSVMLASGDENSLALSALLNFGIWNSDQYQMYQIWYNGFQQAGEQWEDRNGSEPCGGAEETKKALNSKVFKLTVEKKEGENFLHVLVLDVRGNTKMDFVTGELDADVMSNVSFVGVRTWSGDAKINDFKLVSKGSAVEPPPTVEPTESTEPSVEPTASTEPSEEPEPSAPASSETSWKMHNATKTGDRSLTLGKENDEAWAYYVTKEAKDAWVMSADFDVTGYNGNMATLSVALASGDADSIGLEALLNFGIWNSEEHRMYQIWYAGFQQAGAQWEDRSGSEPCSGAEATKKALASRVFNLTVEKKSGENCLHVQVKDTSGSTKLSFVTGNLDPAVMERISYAGIRAYSGNAKVSGFAFAAKGETLDRPTTPQTGDSFSIAIMGTLMLISAVMLVVLMKSEVLLRKK